MAPRARGHRRTEIDGEDDQRVFHAVVDRDDTLIRSLRERIAKASFFQRLLDRQVDVTDRQVDVTGATVEARALIIAAMQDHSRRPIAVVTAGDAAVDDFENALRLFHRAPECVSVYPAPSLSPYQDVAPSQGIVREEIRA